MKTISKDCLNCNQKFDAPLREVNRGNGKYCSKKCSSDYRKGKPTKVKVPNVVCSLCSKEFYLPKSKLDNSKSGHFFCCREHKDKAQRIGGIQDIMPPHYGTASGIRGYRAKAMNDLPNKCHDCQWDDIPEVLTVHHIDCNRRNNDISNLMILCGRCHDIRHFLSKTGKWHNCS